jgi:redox-sensitive bicupin YhaK (pirin superfamily)
MRDAEYRDLQPGDIPTATLPGGASARVVSGRVGDVVGPLAARTTEPVFVEVILPEGGEAVIPVPRGHEGFVYPFEGSVVVGERTLVRGELGVLGAGEHVHLRASGKAARALVIAGKPLREPIVQHGPFVMNTVAEIEQAIRDYQAGTF